MPVPGSTVGLTAAVHAAEQIEPASGDAQLVFAAGLGFAVVILLITVAKVHPFLSLVFGALVLGVTAGFGPEETITSFSGGVGTTVGGVGLLIAVGAMIGGLLAESGGADRIVASVVDNVSAHRLPWAIAGVASLIGLPLFFEVGVVLLIPVVLLASRRTTVPLLTIAIPALAGLSVLHGLVPPHPGPLAAIGTLNADLGLTLLFGLIIAIPTVIVAGPVFGNLISRYVVAVAPDALIPSREPVSAGAGPVPRDAAAASADEDEDGPRTKDVDDSGAARVRRSPAFWPAVMTILLPVVLMLLRAVGELTMDEGSGLRSALEVIGAPLVALLAGLVVAMFTLGFAAGFNREEVSATVGGALPAIAGILLIVAAGGGFKQVLIDAGIGQMIADAANGANLSPLILGWFVAVGIRLATGSATVATITAAGIVTPLAADLSSPTVALLVLAIGSGSLFFSHVNDAGFWLVKEYFGLTVGQTIRTWSVMETIISVVGFVFVFLLSLIL